MKTNKLLSFLLAVVLCVGMLPAVSAQAAPLTDVRAIPGIDYDRFTQEVTKGAASYDVDLTLGELSFPGKLAGSHGLSIEEMNTVINQVLKEKGLTPQRVELVSALAARLQTDAGLAWGDQIIEGLLKFIPSIPGYGVNDFYTWYVHGEGKDAEAVGADLAKEAALAALANREKLGGLLAVGKAGAKDVPLLGELATTLEIAGEWLEGSKRFEDYKGKLEQAMGDVTAFYAICSQRMNDLAEQKGGVVWRIAFDKPTQTYNCTFWGISGVMMEASLSGVLEQAGESGDYAGEYRGTLWLDIEGVDMASFDSRFCAEHNFIFKTAINGWQSSPGFSGYEDIPNQKTALTRQVQGEISVMITGGSGTQTSEVSGSLTADGDETTFAFDHTINGTAKIGYSTTTYTTRITTSTIESVDRSYKSVQVTEAPFNETSTKVMWDKNDKGIPADIGTVWQPLESKPALTVYFGR